MISVATVSIGPRKNRPRLHTCESFDVVVAVIVAVIVAVAVAAAACF